MQLRLETELAEKLVDSSAAEVSGAITNLDLKRDNLLAATQQYKVKEQLLKDTIEEAQGANPRPELLAKYQTNLPTPPDSAIFSGITRGGVSAGVGETAKTA